MLSCAAALAARRLAYSGAGLREYLRQYALLIVDFKRDFPVHVYVEMEVGHFYLFEHIRQLDVLIPHNFLALYHETNRNRVPQFCCNFSCLHNVFHLSFLLVFYTWLLAL